jgi:excisionase family DNA binding protein
MSPAPPNPSSPYLTVAQAAALLQVSRETVYDWVRGRKIDFLALPGVSIRIPRAAIDGFLCPARPTPAPATLGSSDQVRGDPRATATAHGANPAIPDGERPSLSAAPAGASGTSAGLRREAAAIRSSRQASKVVALTTRRPPRAPS